MERNKLKKNNLKNIDLKKKIKFNKKKSNHGEWNWKIIPIKKKVKVIIKEHI